MGGTQREGERMAVNMVTGDGISEAESPLLDDVVAGFVNFHGHPSRRSKSGVEMAERFAYNGVNSNLISYLTGPLGQSTAVAAANVNAWSGTAWLVPLLGAFIADSFLGRYRTIIIAGVIYILGLGFLSLSSALHSFSSCTTEVNDLACSPPTLEVIAFFFSLYLVAFGEGGLRPCIQAFGADQFNDKDIKESKAKSSFFNWYYFALCGGSLLAILFLNYIQDNLSWALGYGIPCIVTSLVLIVFLLGSTTYRFQIKSDDKNPFVRIIRVFAKATRNWQVAPPTVTSIEEETQQILPNESTSFEFLDKAILEKEDGNVCSIRDVDDAKAILGLLPTWITCLGYGILLSQVSTLFTKQGSTMDRYIIYGFQIPAASLQSLISLTVIVFIPIYDRILVPIARAITKKHGGISMLQRIGTGLFLSFLCMVIAALVERRRLAIAVEYGLVDEPTTTLPMSVWWLAPQYLLFGIADVFVIVGLQEFFYDQAPSELKSIGLALYLSILGIGSFLSSFLISIIDKATSKDGRDSWFSNNTNRAHIDYFYWLLAGISAVTLVAYAYFARSYVYKRAELV